MNNAELIVSMLEDAGVRWAFGVPSGPVLPLIEAMRNSRIEYVLTASETSAGFHGDHGRGDDRRAGRVHRDGGAGRDEPGDRRRRGVAGSGARHRDHL